MQRLSTSVEYYFKTFPHIFFCKEPQPVQGTCKEPQPNISMNKNWLNFADSIRIWQYNHRVQSDSDTESSPMSHSDESSVQIFSARATGFRPPSWKWYDDTIPAVKHPPSQIIRSEMSVSVLYFLSPTTTKNKSLYARSWNSTLIFIDDQFSCLMWPLKVLFKTIWWQTKSKCLIGQMRTYIWISSRICGVLQKLFTEEQTSNVTGTCWCNKACLI